MDDQKFSLFPTPRDPTVPLLRKLFWQEVIELPLTGGYFCRRVGHEVPTLTALGKGDDVTDGVGPTEDGHQAVQPCTENFCNGPLTHIHICSPSVVGPDPVGSGTFSWIRKINFRIMIQQE